MTEGTRRLPDSAHNFQKKESHKNRRLPSKAVLEVRYEPSTEYIKRSSVPISTGIGVTE